MSWVAFLRIRDRAINIIQCHPVSVDTLKHYLEAREIGHGVSKQEAWEDAQNSGLWPSDWPCY
jgi:hypothetical protein